MRVILLSLLVTGLLNAQPYYRRHYFTLGGGAGLPRGDLNAVFNDSFGLNVNYGYRFVRYFQADVGLDTLFGAAGVRDFLDTSFGPRRIRDYQFFVPFGGRAILPLAGDRLLIYGSGGGAYMRYTELLSQPSDFFRIDCPVCTARSGWGYYAGFGFSAAVDRGQFIRIGAGTRVYRGHTDGEPIGAAPALRTKDRWVRLMAQVSFSF